MLHRGLIIVSGRLQVRFGVLPLVFRRILLDERPTGRPTASEDSWRLRLPRSAGEVDGEREDGAHHRIEGVGVDAPQMHALCPGPITFGLAEHRRGAVCEPVHGLVAQVRDVGGAAAKIVRPGAVGVVELSVRIHHEAFADDVVHFWVEFQLRLVGAFDDAGLLVRGDDLPETCMVLLLVDGEFRAKGMFTGPRQVLERRTGVVHHRAGGVAAVLQPKARQPLGVDVRRVVLEVGPLDGADVGHLGLRCVEARIEDGVELLLGGEGWNEELFQGV